MCGIVGYYRFDQQQVDQNLLVKQVASIHHRGPDANGIWVKSHVGLGHVRLSIIDLSESGKQPMVSPDERYVLSYNGEIYNYQQLKNTFPTPYPYVGTSDTEVLRNGLVDQGTDFINKLEGMFAFAFYDQEKDELTIARDPFGIKPLYYYQDEEKIVFASEIKALLEDKTLKIEINQEALKEYFLLGYSLDPETSYKGIKRLEPGCILKIDRSGVQCERFFSISDLIVDEPIDPMDWLDMIEESVALHAIADVPIGAFLSGGLDSNLLIHLLKKRGLLEGTFRAFNAGKNGEGHGPVYWERRAARQSSEHYGVQLVEINSDEEKFMSFESVIDIIEEPICNPSNYLIDKICATARAGGQKVLLSGHGGDEIFAGYRRHLTANYLGYIRNLGLGSLILQTNKLMPNNLLFRVGQAAQRSNQFPLLSLVGIGASFVDGKNSIAGEWISKDDLDRIGEKLYSFIPQERNLSYLKQSMFLEFGTYLASQNLINMDKFSMKHSVEVRVPFLYRPLARIGLNTPDKILIKGKETKSIIRRSGSAVLPEFLTNKPKSGFAPHQSNLIQKDEVKSLVLSDSIRQNGMFNASLIEKQFYSGNKVSETQALQLMNIATIEAWLNRSY